MISWGGLVIASAVLVEPAAADVAAAAEAFGNAQRAELAHDYARAAEFYELADSMAPSPEALRSAAKTRFAAGDKAVAATLALGLQRRYTSDPISSEVAERILEETRDVLVQVDVRCDRPCVVSVEGRAVGDTRALSHHFFAEPGVLDLSAGFERGVYAETSIEGEAGQVTAVQMQRPSVPAPSDASNDVAIGTTSDPIDDGGRRPTKRGRLRPAYFAVGAVLTVGSGAALLWSGLDVLNQNDRYEADPTRARFDSGRRAEVRTNVLIATTATMGVATVVLGVFTDWSRGRASAPAEQAGWTGRGMEFRF